MSNQRIIYTGADGVLVVVIPAGGLPIEDVAAQDVPPGVPYEIVSLDDIPSDRTFRGAWVQDGSAVGHDISAAKAIAHDMRRTARSQEFAPLDDIIAKQIPGTTIEEAEAARQEIRDRYAMIQDAVDSGQSVDDLKAALNL
jgi:hypothetical protein